MRVTRREHRGTGSAWRGGATILAAIVAGLIALPATVPATAATSPHQVIDGGAVADAQVSEAMTESASLAGFDAGNIISDPVFYNSNAMSEAEIAAFLQRRGSGCGSTASLTCLKDYSEATYSFPGDAYCSGYSSNGTESAARMIWMSAQACGINPQVLLVTLQKEQSLVTVGRSGTTYKRAMGFGCPDNAGGACDPQFAGFHVQVYYSARQFVRYGALKNTFNYFPVGRTSNIKYNVPDSCGTSPVLIRNQATANLYYYTPYQPNAAALAANWGTGDGCSAYGNRNFYNYFTDWFGSTQSAVTSMVSVGQDIYLLSGGSRIHLTASNYAEYQRVFGSPVSISQQYLNLYNAAGDASLFVRSTATGAISLLQDGRKFHFDSCAEVAAWGGACGTETPLAAAEYDRIPSGPGVGAFVRNGASPVVYWFQNGRMTPLHNYEALLAVAAGGDATSVAMPSNAFNRYPVDSVRFAPARLIRPAGEDAVYLPTWDGRLIYLSSYVWTAGIGISSATDLGVPEASLRGYQRTGELGAVVRCGATTYLGSQGALVPVTATAVAGFAVTALDDRTCDSLRRMSTAPLNQVFVKGVGRNEVYLATAGSLRHVTSGAALRSLAGGVDPAILPLADGAIDLLPKGPAFSNEDTNPTIAQAGNDLYVLSGGKRAHLTLANYQQYLQVFGPAVAVSRQYVERFTDAGDATFYIRNSGTGEIALLQEGRRARFDSCDEVAAWGGACGAETVLATAQFDRIPSGPEVGPYVRTGGSGTIYTFERQRLLPFYNQEALLAHSGGVWPDSTVMPAEAFARYTRWGTRFAPARLITIAGSDRVYLPTADAQLVYLPSFDYATAWGVSTTVERNVPANLTSGYATGRSMSLFVQCGSTTYLAAGGGLQPVSTSAHAGFSPTLIDGYTCGALRIGANQPLDRIFLQGQGRGEIWLAQNGALRHVSTYAAFLQLGGGSAPMLNTVPAGIVDNLAKGPAIN